MIKELTVKPENLIKLISLKSTEISAAGTNHRK